MEIMWKIKELCTRLVGKPPHYSQQPERHDDQSESSQSSDEMLAAEQTRHSCVVITLNDILLA